MSLPLHCSGDQTLDHNHLFAQVHILFPQGIGHLTQLVHDPIQLALKLL